MRVLSGFLVVFTLTVTPARAQAPADAAVPRVALDTLVAQALAANPEIAAAQHRVEAARARPAQERSLPDPTLSVGYNSSGRPWPGAGLGSEPTSNIGVMVSQPLPYPGKRDLKAAVAAHEADAESERFDAAKLDIVARVKQAYFGLAYTYAAEDVLARNRTLLDTLLRVSEGRYSVGRAEQQDVFKAQTELSLIELQLERIRQERAAREAELNALVAAAPGAPVGRPADLALVAFDTSLDTLLADAEANAPALKADAAVAAGAQAALAVAHREYKPDFAVTGGYYSMGSMPSMYMFRFDVNVPLQRERRAAAVGERASSLAQAQSTIDATRLDLQARVQQEYQTATTSLRLARLYRDTVLPQVRLALEASLASYQTGRVEFLSVLTNAGSVLQYEMTYYDELAAFHAAASRIEELTGTPMEH